MSGMHIDLKVGESITIGAASLRLVEKSGQRVRLMVQADPSIKISRPQRPLQPSSRAQECAPLPPKEPTCGEHAL